MLLSLVFYGFSKCQKQYYYWESRLSGAVTKHYICSTPVLPNHRLRLFVSPNITRTLSYWCGDYHIFRHRKNINSFTVSDSIFTDHRFNITINGSVHLQLHFLSNIYYCWKPKWCLNEQAYHVLWKACL